MLMRSLKKAKPHTKTQAYKTICRPILEYSSVVWSPYKQKHIKILEGVNRKAFRWAHRLSNRDQISELMTSKTGKPFKKEEQKLIW
jgi:hypothetical protein